MCLTSHSLTLLTCNYLHHCILTISLCEIKGKMSKLPKKLKYCWNLKVMLKYFVRERKNTSFIKSKIVDNNQYAFKHWYVFHLPNVIPTHFKVWFKFFQTVQQPHSSCYPLFPCDDIFDIYMEIKILNLLYILKPYSLT